jgi:protein phosphatase 1B
LIHSSFDALDKALLGSEKVKIEEDRSGTTVVACLITPKKIFLINCGDSRAILVRNSRVELSTFDHKPSQLRERKRIHNAGGLVALQRVNGGLATSRSLGDLEYKNVKSLDAHQQFVISKPDIYPIAKDANGDQFIILACDGIWDVMSNEDVKTYMENSLRNETVDYDVLHRVNDQLLDDCLKKVRFFTTK